MAQLKKEVCFGGTLTKDAELYVTQSGSAVCKLNIAYKTGKPNDSEYGESAYINVSVWGNQAEIISKILKKGDTISGFGGAYKREYTKNDGTQGVSNDIDCRLVNLPIDRLLELLKEDSKTENIKPEEKLNFVDIGDDDLPF